MKAQEFLKIKGLVNAGLLVRDHSIYGGTHGLAKLLEDFINYCGLPHWTPVKPDFPCLFVARIKSKWGTTTEIFTIDKTEGYLRLISNDGMEDEALEDLQADEYFIIERLK